MATKKKKRESIKRSKLARLAAVNSDKLPGAVECDGKRMEWVGIGWIDCGKPKGSEVLVVEG